MTTPASEERKLVLEMLADGKINVDDAQRLLDKLQDVENAQPDEGRAKAASSPRAKHLRIQTVSENGCDELNLRIPLGLVRAGLALESFLPSWATNSIVIGLEDDMTDLDSDYLRKNLDQLDLRFESGSGESLHIFSE